MDDDWDLHAVVRSCSSTTSTATTAVDSRCFGQELSNFEKDCSFSATNWSQDLLEARKDNFIEELHDLFKPILPKPQEPSQIGIFSPKTLPISPHSVLGRPQDLSSEQRQQKQQAVRQFPQQKQELFSVVNGSKPSPRSKKRKNHLKKVCHVPAEGLSNDIWSWRKYGQKPIKGSPYPRGYYRCSTSKGCMARKQVERNRSDPGMFIVTYTGEHNHPVPTHRNSLAGSTRHKPADDSKKPETSPGLGLSPVPEKMESSREDLAEAEEDEEEDDLSASKMELDDDFFAGLEDFAGECLSDPIPADSEFNWLASGAATTSTAAAGGGGS
ncbi:hypothetical protein ACS0TY_002419 [Phlomoides rotata]